MNSIMSIAQFRPEKYHELQVRAVQRSLEVERELERGEAGHSNGKVMMEERLGSIMLTGSCRNEEDRRQDGGQFRTIISV